jgi:hypothetical protein
MAVTEDLLIQISADTAKATVEITQLNKNLKDLEKTFLKMGDSTAQVEKSVSGFGSKVVILNQAFELTKKALSGLVAPISKMVFDFLKAEDAADSLGKTLAVLGETNVGVTVSRFSELGDSLENLTNVDKEVVLSLAKTGATFGLTNDQIEKFIKTAIDLSAVTGDDVASSFQALIMAMQGNIRSLGPLKVLVSDLSTAQLIAGQATDVLSEKLNGLGAEKAQTNIGRLETILRKLGDTGKIIGEIIVNGLNLSSLQNSTIQILDEINASLTKLKPNAIEAFSNIKISVESASATISRLMTVLSDFKNIFDDNNKSVQSFATSLVIVTGSATTLAILLSGNFYAALSAVVIKFGEMATTVLLTAKNMAVLSIRILAVGGAIATLTVGLDLLINNIKNLGDVWTTVYTSIITGLGILIQKLSVFIGLGKQFEKVFGKFFDSVAEKGAKAAENLDFGKSGEIWEAVTAKFSTGVDDINKSTEDLNKTLGNTDQTGRKTFSSLGFLTEQGKSLIDELNKKVLDLQKTLSETGASEGQKIALNLKGRLAEIDLLEKKLRSESALNKKTREQIDSARQLAKAIDAQERKELGTKNLNDQIKLTKDLAREIEAKDATTIDRINLKKQADLDELDRQKEILMRDKEINKTALDQIEANKKLVKLKAEQEKESAPGVEFEIAKRGGENIATGITQAFQEGTMGAVMGAMAGASAIADAIQGLIDFIPQFLDKMTNIFTSLSDLPRKIADGFLKLSDSILEFVKNIVSNIGSMLQRLPDILLEFVTKLPDAIAQFLDQIPEVIFKLLDRLPEIIEKLVTALIIASPKIMIAWIKFLVEKSPQIALAIAKSLAIELPKAIINGIIDAFKQLQNLFKGAAKQLLPKPADIAKNFALGLKAVSKNLTGIASKLFAVFDLEETARTQSDKLKDLVKSTEELIKDLSEAAKNAGKSMWDAFVQAFNDAIEWFKDRGKEIWDGLVKAFRAVAKWFGDRGKEIWDGFIVPVAMWFKERGKEIWDGFILPVAMWFKERGKEIWDGFISPVLTWFADKGKEIWNGFITPIADFFIQAGIAIWRGFYDSIGMFFSQAGQAIWIGLLQPIGDFFANAGKTIWNNFYAAVSNFFEQFGQRIFNGLTGGLNSFDFGNIGTRIWNGLKNGLSNIGSVISDQLSKINPGNIFGKIFDVSGAFDGERGTIEKTLGFDMPFMSFARGGKVPGNATVSGDSLLNDKILALLSPGEYVIPRSVMDDPTAQALIKSLVEGNKLPQFAFGGELAKVAKGLSSLIPGMSIDDLWAGIFDKVKDAIWKIFENNKFHNGGEVPAILKPGEFVINRGAASSVGTDFLNAVNSGNMPSNNMNQEVTINLTINTTQAMDESFIRNKIYPVVKEQIKRASLDGQTMIYSPGVRSL